MEHSNVRGDMSRPLPVVPELEKATVVYEKTETPFWDFDVSSLKRVHSHPNEKELIHIEIPK